MLFEPLLFYFNGVGSDPIGFLGLYITVISQSALVLYTVNIIHCKCAQQKSHWPF